MVIDNKKIGPIVLLLYPKQSDLLTVNEPVGVQGCIFLPADIRINHTQDISLGSSPPQDYPDSYLRNRPLHRVPGNLVNPITTIMDQ